MEKTASTLSEVILFTLGVIGVRFFVWLHNLLTQVDAETFALACVITLGIAILFRNKTHKKDN